MKIRARKYSTRRHFALEKTHIFPFFYLVFARRPPRARARQRVARLHEKIENRRSDFLHKASRAMADSYGTVYVEDLRIRNMVRNRRLAKSISDAGWGRFVGMLCYKEEESGGRVILVNPRGTSQVCSGCGG